jgi:hypothetical protein
MQDRYECNSSAPNTNIDILSFVLVTMATIVQIRDGSALLAAPVTLVAYAVIIGVCATRAKRAALSRGVVVTAWLGAMLLWVMGFAISVNLTGVALNESTGWVVAVCVLNAMALGLIGHVATHLGLRRVRVASAVAAQGSRKKRAEARRLRQPRLMLRVVRRRARVSLAMGVLPLAIATQRGLPLIAWVEIVALTAGPIALGLLLLRPVLITRHGFRAPPMPVAEEERRTRPMPVAVSLLAAVVTALFVGAAQIANHMFTTCAPAPEGAVDCNVAITRAAAPDLLSALGLALTTVSGLIAFEAVLRARGVRRLEEWLVSHGWAKWRARATRGIAASLVWISGVMTCLAWLLLTVGFASFAAAVERASEQTSFWAIQLGVMLGYLAAMATMQAESMRQTETPVIFTADAMANWEGSAHQQRWLVLALIAFVVGNGLQMVGALLP